jgi:hypothetical protein
MALIQVTGRIGSINASNTVFILWEKVELKNGSTMNRMWKLWGDASLGLGEGDYLTVRGEYSSSPEVGMDGLVKTYTNAKGQVVSNYDLMINFPEIMELKPSATKTFESAGIDGDDARKYGGSYGHLKTDDSPF